jgi:hypothetical protein
MCTDYCRSLAARLIGSSLAGNESLSGIHVMFARMRQPVVRASVVWQWRGNLMWVASWLLDSRRGEQLTLLKTLRATAALFCL